MILVCLQAIRLFNDFHDPVNVRGVFHEQLNITIPPAAYSGDVMAYAVRINHLAKLHVDGDVYGVMLKDYPDVMNIEEMSRALGVSTKTGYKLLRTGKITAMKVGRTYRIPKVHLLTYLRVLDADRAS